MKYALWLKITAFLLLLLFLCIALLSGAALASSMVLSPSEWLREFTYNDISNDIGQAYWDCENSLYISPDRWLSVLEQCMEHYEPNNTNFCFEILDPDGNVLFQSPKYPTELLASHSESFRLYHSESTVDTLSFYGESEAECWGQYYQYCEKNELKHPDIFESSINFDDLAEQYVLSVSIPSDPVDIVIHGGIRQSLKAPDQYMWMYNLCNAIYSHSKILLSTAISSAILALVLFIYLICAAGHKQGCEEIYVNWFNRIPLDVFAALTLGAALICVGIASELLYHNDSVVFLLSIVSLTPAAAMILVFLLSFAVRVKAQNVFRNTLCFRVVRFLRKCLRWCCRAGKSGLIRLSISWKAALFFCLITLAECFTCMISESAIDFLAFFLLPGKLILLGILLYYVPNLKKLQTAGQELAKGNLGYKVNLYHMPPSLKQHAANLNSIGYAMEHAVSEQTKSERMKAELITNVSHDLKTPLTSIINYVDLLKREPVGSEAAASYLEVLDRQSARLKKLTVDLVDASKASSGAMPVELSPTDVNLVLNQSLAEYSEKLESANLMPVLTEDETLPQIMADGRLLWRIFDNLLGNACKYAMPGTRVYISSSFADEKIHVCFKNISHNPLNISADELMERFVRGDSSRSTEGSGLGLSIAKSLAELQGGTLALSIDGDLFRADVILPCP